MKGVYRRGWVEWGRVRHQSTMKTMNNLPDLFNAKATTEKEFVMLLICSLPDYSPRKRFQLQSSSRRRKLGMTMMIKILYYLKSDFSWQS